MANGPMETMKVSCLCGASAYSAQVPAASLPLTGELCHCDSCRHTTGAMSMNEVRWPDEIPESDTLTEHVFNSRVRTYFCSTCGAGMFVRNVVSKNKFVLTGVLEDPAKFVRFDKHCWIGDTKDGGLSDWLPSVGGATLERWAQNEHASEELPLGWKAENGPASEDRTLAAYCKCKSVNFLITRPTEASAKSPYVDPTNAKVGRGAWWLASNERYIAGLCACSSCRLAAGLEVTPWAFVPLANMTLATGEPFDYAAMKTLKSYRSSPRATRYFCGTCGAVAFYEADERPPLLDVAVGLLDAPTGARADKWLEWRGVNWTQDAINLSLVDSLVSGMKDWTKLAAGG